MSPKKYARKKYDLEKAISTDQAFFLKTSCFGIDSFLLGTKTALHAVACGRKTNLMRNTVQSNQKSTVRLLP